jgi:hypothetical protein
MRSILTPLLLGPLLTVSLCACGTRTPPPPQSPAARQEEAAAAERKAASIEAEMNKDAESEDVAKQPGTPQAPASEPPPPPSHPTTGTPAP